jgi:hypothetical protein
MHPTGDRLFSNADMMEQHSGPGRLNVLLQPLVSSFQLDHTVDDYMTLFTHYVEHIGAATRDASLVSIEPRSATLAFHFTPVT